MSERGNICVPGQSPQEWKSFIFNIHMYFKKSKCEWTEKNKIAWYVDITEYIWLNTSEILVDSRFRARSGPNLVYLLRKNEGKWRNKVENQWSKNHKQIPPKSFLVLSHYPSGSRQVTGLFLMVISLIFLFYAQFLITNYQ